MIDPRIPVTELPPLTEFRRSLIGVGALNPFVTAISPGRMQMFTNSHLAQRLTTSGCSEPYWQVGMESELGKATFSVKMPVRARILKKIERYPFKQGTDTIQTSPETIILYEDMADKRLGMISIKRYFSYHSYFGFPYKNSDTLSKLQVGDIIPAGTILQDTPAKMDNGNYAYGLEMKVAMIGHPAIAEDGVVICRDQLHKLKFMRYETRSVEWGDKDFALIIHGLAGNGDAKIFPDIGDMVTNDGMLMALRTYNPRLAPVDLNVNALRQVDYAHDKHIHAYGPRGKVIDVIVTANTDITKGISPLNNQVRKYIDARQEYCQNLVDTYYAYKRNNKGLKLTRELHLALVRAMVELRVGGNRLMKLYRKAPLDQFRVDFVIEYEITPYIGCKVTGPSGDKGIIVHIAEPDEMPVDDAGVRADLLMGPEARTNRMNVGGLSYTYFTSVAQKVRELVCQELQVEMRPSTSHQYAEQTPENHRASLRQYRWADQTVRDIYDNDRERFMRAWNWLILYYRCVARISAYAYDGPGGTDEARISAIVNVVSDFVYTFGPQDYQPNYFEAALLCEEYIKPLWGTITYKGYSGRLTRTKKKVRISSMLIFLLEKTASDWSAVSSPKIQHFGFFAQISKADKYLETGRRQPIKGVGETEGRIIAAYCGAQAVVEIMDRNNSPATHHAINLALLEADHPTNISMIIDRAKMPYGAHKGIQAFRHVLNCMCLDVAYVEEEGT